MEEIEVYRSRVHFLLLYPDNPDHLGVLEKVKKSYDYCAIIHDKDTWTAEDEKKNSCHKSGEKKKTHVHVVLRFTNAVWNTAVCKGLGLDERFCEQVKNIDKALQYLVHYNEPDKHQYEMEEVFGSLKHRLLESIKKLEKTEGEKALDLIKYFKENEGYISMTEFAEYCAVNGYWDVFRRAGGVFARLIDEHNAQVRSSERPGAGLYQDAKDRARFEGVVIGHEQSKKKEEKM